MSHIQHALALQDGVLSVSHSSLSRYRSCERKFEFSKLFIASRGETGYAGSVGHALHRSTQDYLLHKDEDRALAILGIEFPYELMPSPMDNRGIAACVVTVEDLFRSGLLVGYELAEIKCLDGEVRPAIEVPFRIRFSDLELPFGLKFEYTGFIDAIVYNRLTQEYSVIDIKTHRDSAIYQVDVKFRYSEQPLPYGFVLENIVGNHLKDFDVYFLSMYIDPLEPNNQLLSYTKTSEDVHDWAKSVLKDARDIGRYIEQGWFPRRGNACKAFGKYVCPHFDLCDLRDWERMQQMMMPVEPEPPKKVEPWIDVELRIAT